MTVEQITHILDQIDANKECLSSMRIMCGAHDHIIDLNYATIEFVHASQLLKIASFDEMMVDTVLIDIKSIDSITLYRKEP